MGGSSSSPQRKGSESEQSVTEVNTAREVIKNVETRIAFADGVRLEKSKLLDVMFADRQDNCTCRGRALMQNCFDKLIGQQGNNYLSPQEFEHLCTLILDGHCDSSSDGANKDFHRRIKSDRQLVKLLLLERDGKPDAEIVEDILLLAYAASLQPAPIISGAEEDFANKLSVAMLQSCESIDALLVSWERCNLPIASSCRSYFAHRLLNASSNSQVACSSAEPLRPNTFSTHIGSFGLWILCEILPPAYSPPPPPLAAKTPAFTQWQMLYDCGKDGLSFSRLESLVFDYKSPTLVLFSFNHNVFVAGIDCEWRKGVMKWGGSDCCLFQLLPSFHMVESNPGMIVCNTKDRSVARGIHFGSKITHIEIDDGLNEVKLYGVPSRLDWIQVIGCGPSNALNAQQEYRQLTTEDARRLKDKKLHADEWGVDTKILDWGGVQRGNLAKNYGVDAKGTEFQHVEGTSSEPPTPSN